MEEVAKKSATVFNIIKIKAEQAAAVAATKKGAAGVALLLLAVIAWTYGSAGHALSAALYIFANDGKVSGRMSGDVKMRNGRQRGFTVPSLVQNVYTSIVRSRFQGLSSSYRGLTAGDIATWVNATGYTYTDRFAASHALKGKGLYMRLNSNLLNLGLSPISTAPLATGVSPVEITGGLSSNLTSTLSQNFLPSPVPTGFGVIVFATTSLNIGITRPSKSAYRQIAILNTADVSPRNLWVEYTAKFGTPVVGANVFFKFITVNAVTGEASAASINIQPIGA